MAADNPSWGAPRVHGELLKPPGFKVEQSTVSVYLKAARKPGSGHWRQFISGRADKIAACDFFAVPTVGFGVLYAFLVMSLDRRRILRIDVTKHPTAAWTAKQLRLAYPSTTSHGFLIRDAGGNYGPRFEEAVGTMGMKQIVTGCRGNSYCERLIQTIQRECTDHFIIRHEAHLRRILREYMPYYNVVRTHCSLGKDAPDGRDVDPPENGARIVAVSHLGGLHHHYVRQAA